MRTSFLSRSVIAVASLGIGSVALAATPATAATSSGVTRDMVLTAVNGLRLDEPSDAQYLATLKAVRSIAIRACGADADSGDIVIPGGGMPLTAGDDAEGVIIETAIVNIDTFNGRPRMCSIAAFATADASFELSGTASLTGQRQLSNGDVSDVVTPLVTAALSGDVFVSTHFGVSGYANLSVSASGDATKTTSVTSSEKVASPKTAEQNKAAKKAHSKALKSAKRSYTKALKKAGDSKKMKAAAKKAYAKKKAAAKAKYQAATASFKIMTKTTHNVENRPFALTTPEWS